MYLSNHFSLNQLILTDDQHLILENEDKCIDLKKKRNVDSFKSVDDLYAQDLRSLTEESSYLALKTRDSSTLNNGYFIFR